MTGPLVTAAELADLLAVSRDYVYEHADELGALRLGSGPKARLRFDPAAVREAMTCSVSKSSPDELASNGGASAPTRSRRSARRPNGRPQPGQILPIRPRRKESAR